ncbi:hypothetical protein LTV02_11805 [Nocardia yamanashiensis]|uniref:hypothetical protein n=1 Tax=Nocardia yamanashiensis TaxID=209247 RepID=UPI001E63DE5C|nr:hypothetical protein [Nocardia yamanashiensis]UGT44018.1 hypothetical protein LTV02_11805 [Nocardia yamanashiensis]
MGGDENEGDRPDDEQVSVLLIADPGKPAAVAEQLAERLPELLRSRDRSGRRWMASVRSEPYLPDEQADLAEVIDAVDPSAETEDLVIYLTDLPRRADTLPIVAEVSTDHRFALVSVPGVGGLRLEQRLHTVTELAISRMLGDPELTAARAERKFPSTPIPGGTRYFAPPGLRRLRLLSGMVRANRPWRLVTGLSKVLVGAFATGAVALATSTIWQFADTMGPWRMSAATVLSMMALILWLILDHELWERPKSRADRNRSALYNAATALTLITGVAVLHLALFAMLLATASLTLPPGLFTRELGHTVTFTDYLTLAWLLASVATIGGALGSGLEDDTAVTEAAYGIRQRQRLGHSGSPSRQ